VDLLLLTGTGSFGNIAGLLGEVLGSNCLSQHLRWGNSGASFVGWGLLMEGLLIRTVSAELPKWTRVSQRVNPPGF